MFRIITSVAVGVLAVPATFAVLGGVAYVLGYRPPSATELAAYETWLKAVNDKVEALHQANRRSELDAQLAAIDAKRDEELAAIDAELHQQLAELDAQRIVDEARAARFAVHAN
jgi:hypothetical protein